MNSNCANTNHEVQVRNACEDDCDTLARIYSKYIMETTISFETSPVTPQEMLRRMRLIIRHCPYFVAELDGKVVGYAYAHPWKERAAYRHTLETTVYVDAAYTHQGIGSLLVKRLIAACKQLDCHALIACITGGNTPSINMHSRLGFCPVSSFKQVGYKFGRWLDVVDMELQL